MLPNETPDEAAVREFRDECGLRVENPTWERYEHNLILSDFGRNRYEKCHRISPDDVRRASRQTLIHVFTADIVWEGPVAEKFNELLRDDPGAPLVIRLGPEDDKLLGVEEAGVSPNKVQEIMAIGLFPLDELLDFERPHEGFYTSHLNRMRRALEKYTATVPI